MSVDSQPHPTRGTALKDARRESGRQIHDCGARVRHDIDANDVLPPSQCERLRRRRSIIAVVRSQTRDLVDARDLLGERDRVVLADQRDRRAEADPFGRGGDRDEYGERVVRVGVVESALAITLVNPGGLPKVDIYRQVSIATGSKLVFIAGQVARDADGGRVGEGDLAAQVEQCYLNILRHRSPTPPAPRPRPRR